MPTIRVEIPSRNQTIEFDQGTPESVIQDVIKRDFPRNGQDVAYEIAQLPGFSKKISDEDFVLYEDYLDKKKTDYVSAFAGGVSGIAETVGKGVAGIFQLRNLDPRVATSTAIEGAAQGTRDLYGMIAQSTDPTSYMFKFTNWLNGTGTVQDRKAQWIEANEFTERSERIARGEEAIVPGINPAFVNADVRNAIGLVADPSVLIPGLNVGAQGAKVVGAGLRAGGRVAQAVTRPLVSAIDRVGEVASEALGTKLDSVRNVAAGTGISGLALGVPGVSQAAAVIGGVEAVSKLGRVAEQAGEQLLQAPTRIGPLESIGRAPNATSIDRALGRVGRFGGDDLIDIGTRSLAGAVEGATIGGLLGGLSQGEEGFAAGIGSGGALGAGAAGLVRGVQKASGVAARQARENDYQIFRDGLDEADQSKFDTIVKNSGIDGAVQVMDTAGIIRGKFNDAEIRFLTSEEFTKEHGANARGVKIVNVEAQRPVVKINVDKISSERTAFHELFHVFKAIDNLRPAAEKVERTIVGNWIIDKNGDSVQTSPGFMDEAQILSRFDEYASKLADNDPARKINTVAEKAAFVGEELASEYMSKMIAGSSTDSMLRGFDDFTRTIVDRALLNNNEGFLRRTAQSLGLGSKPIESLLFNNLQEASPALNAQLRDMVRMRRNMDKKLELADEVQVTNIQKKDLSNPVAAQLAVEMNIAEKGADGVTRMKLDDVMSQEDKVSLDSLKSVIKSTPVADVNAPRMRELDGKIVGDGISDAQLAAIQSSPNILDKVKQSFALIKSAIENGEVLYIRNGKATKKITSRLTGKTLTRYNDGVRIVERDGVPYSLAENKAGELYLDIFDISKARRNAMDLASKDRLGPYQADFQAFYGDLVRYLNNLSDPVNRVPSKELLGDAEKAAYLTDFFGQKEGDGKASKFIRSLTLDRMVEMRPTGERVRMTESAYDLNKARFMPAENLGETKVFDAPDTGFRIIAKGNKHSLYAPTGERLGIYDTQAGAERKANITAAKFSPEFSPRFMPTSPDEFLKAAVGDSATNLKMKLAKRLGTGVARNKFVEFQDKVGRPIGIGANTKDGGKPFEVWKRETEQWLNDDEIAASRKWYRELNDKFVGIFGEKKAATMMMAWLAAQQNVSPGGALGNVFKVEDRLAGIGTGKKGGLADEKIQGVLTQTVPEKGFGAKLTDFVDAGFLKNLRTYMGGDTQGGRPFVADVHTGRDSGHVDQQTLSRLAERSAEGDLFIGGKSAQVKITKTKTVKNGDKVSEVPTRVLVRVDGMKPFNIEIDMTGSPSGSQYEGIAEWGNNLTDHLNQAKWKGGDWNPAEAQAVGWMRVLRQYGLAEPTVVSALAQNTSRLYAEVNYGSGATLNKDFPDFGKLPFDVQTAITKDVMERFVPMIAEKIGGSLRVQNISLGDGVFGSTKAPSVAIELLGSAEAVDMFALSLAHASEQAATMSAVFGTGGKDSRSLRFKKADGTKFTDAEINSLLTNAEISGFSVHQLPGGTEALITDAKADYTPKAFTEKKAEILFNKLTDWADKTNVTLDVKAPPTKVTSYANDWSINQEGQTYLDTLNKRGGASRIREITSLRGKYRTVLEQAFEQYAPGVRQQGSEVTGQRFMPAAPDTPAFKKWFGDSKAVDVNGKPLRVYHGTNNDFTKFKRSSRGVLGPGIYFADSPERASSYAQRESTGGNLVSAFLQIEKPLIVEGGEGYDVLLNAIYGRTSVAKKRAASQGSISHIVTSADIRRLRDMGHDGVIWRHKSGDEYLVFEPTQIKSATGNRGTFDATNPDIRFMPEVEFSAPEKLPNGQAWSTNMNYRVIQKTGGKFRVYAPIGTLIGVAESLEQAKRLIEKRNK